MWSFLHPPSLAFQQGFQAWRRLPQILGSNRPTRVIPFIFSWCLLKGQRYRGSLETGGRHVSKEICDHRHITTKDEFLLSHTERGSNPKVWFKLMLTFIWNLKPGMFKVDINKLWAMRQRWVYLHLILRVYLTLLGLWGLVVVSGQEELVWGKKEGLSSVLIFSLSAALENCQNEWDTTSFQGCCKPRRGKAFKRLCGI